MVTLLENIAQVNSDFLSIKNKIVEKGVEVEEGTRTSDYAAKVEQVYEAGKQAEYDAFWDKFQPYGSYKQSYQACFGGKQWNADTLKPKYDVIVNSAIYTFAFNAMKVDLVKYFESIGRKLDFSQNTNANGTFQGAAFTRLGGIYCKGVNWHNCFNGCPNLVTIDEWGDYDGGTISGGLTSTFTGCSALENIKVKGTIIGNINFQWSTKLTKASITSIINALSSTTSGFTLTLSKTAKEAAFTTEEWNALVATKSNWTISLV